MHGDQGLSRVAVVVMHGVCMHREPEEGALTVVPFLPCVSGAYPSTYSSLCPGVVASDGRRTMADLH